MHSEESGRGDLREAAQEEFIEMILLDEDLLRHEFEAIIATNWPPAASRRPSVPVPRPWPLRVVSHQQHVPRRGVRRRQPWPHQRSPPKRVSIHKPGTDC